MRFLNFRVISVSIVCAMFAVLIFMVGASCGGGGGGVATTTTSTGREVTDLSQLPDLDVSSVDTVAPSVAVEPKAATVVTIPDGENSAGGCMTVNFFNPITVAITKASQAPICYLKKTQAAVGADVMLIPSDSYAYYIVSGMKFRIGNFTSNNVTTLKGDVCEDLGSGIEHSTSFDITEDAAATAWDVSLVLRLNAVDSRDFAANDTTITMKNSSALNSAFSFDNVSTVNSVNYLGGGASTADVGSVTTYDSLYSLSFGFDANADNSISAGVDSVADSVTLQAYSLFDALTGASVFDFVQDGAEYSFTESFDMSGDPAIVMAENSFQPTVVAAGLPVIPTAAELSAVLAFGRTWDCLDSSGGTDGFVTDTNGADFTSCDEVVADATTLFDEASANFTACSIIIENALGGGTD